jgi:thioester reductase-like protein
LATDTIPVARPIPYRFPIPRESTTAFLQFTSGSTSVPRGVVITHGNCIYNQLMGQSVSRAVPDTVFLSWVPHFHDLGLVAHILHSFFCGSHCVLLSPASFLSRPWLWWQMATKYHAAITGAPNFAYQLCVERVTSDQKRGMDLSCVRMAMNAAEPVNAQTIDAFATHFADVGFNRRAFLPAYGMAEATVFVSSGHTDQEPRLKEVDWDAFTNRQQIRDPAPSAKKMTLVGCGTTKLGQEIRIVDPVSLTELGDNRIGEIWVAGDNIMRGYYRDAEATASKFGNLPGSEQNFLRTGDLGFRDETGELFVTGRLKDLIIINGANYYPHDIERVVERAHPDIRPGGVAALGVTRHATEELVLLAELDRNGVTRAQRDPGYTARLAEALCAAVGRQFDLAVGRLLLLRPQQLPKTSSGKLRRQECKMRYARGEVDALACWPATSAIQLSGKETVMLTNIEKTLGKVGAMGPMHLKVFSLITQILTRKYNVSLAELDVEKSIFFYGIDSIKIIDIHGELEKVLERPIPTESFFEANSFIGMIDDVVKSLSDDASTRVSTDIAAALRHDIDQAMARLSPLYEQAKQPPQPVSAAHDRIFLTGASGFLGCFLLKELLAATRGRVYCLVRAKDAEAGLERIQHTADKFGVRLPPSSHERIKAIPGDVSKPKFGLSSADYDDLARKFDVVYHCAAVDNFYLPYSVLRNTNVGGTVEIAAFAMAGRLKPLHYVSSCAVSLIDGDPDNVQIVGLVNGYAQSKYAAEQVIQKLIAQGFPAISYRFGYLYNLYIDEIGEENSSDKILASFIKACGQADNTIFVDEDAFESILAAIPIMGCIPGLNANFDLTPVQYAAKCIVASAMKESTDQQRPLVFYNPQPLKWADILSYFTNKHKHVKIVTLDEFVQRFHDFHETANKKSIKLLKSVVSENLERQLNRMFQDVQPDKVEGPGHWCLPCDTRFTHHYVELCVSRLGPNA